ncbi:hypothetical protein PMEGAPR185_50140 [Priestia megaterium]
MGLISFYINYLIIFTTKTAHYLSVYKAVLTVFMLYDYDKNIDNIPSKTFSFLLVYEGIVLLYSYIFTFIDLNM